MTEKHGTKRLALTAALLGGLILGCSGNATPQPASGIEPRSSGSGTGPKILTLGLQQEPPGFNTQIVQGTTTGGSNYVLPIAHNYLMIQDHTFAYRPQLAAEALSTERGTWRVNPDGTMETTWRVRPNVKWHDGAPFTAEDLLFTFNVYKDPDIPNSAGAVTGRMTAASAPDPLTFTIHWLSVYVQADRALALTPVPRHLMQEAYRADKTGFVNSPRFTTEFVGLGPYRLVRWEGGVIMEFARFDDYYLGPPPLDGIIVRFIADPNAMVANILAEAVDVLLPTLSDVETVREVRRRWEGTGNHVIFEVSDSLLHWEIQHRIELARPRNGLTDRSVRQALYHAIDRDTLTEVITGGLAPAADSWIAPTDPLRSHVQTAIPQFPYELRRAEELLKRAGWQRGRDGVLLHQASGERFELMLAGAPGRIREITLIGEGWKTAGVEVELYTIPPALDRDREHRSTLPGVGFVGASGEDFYADRLHSKFMTTAANRWSGPNRGGYSNPRVDALLEKLVVTIEPVERLTLHHALLQEQMGDVALMPLFWRADIALALKRVHNVVGRTTWNVLEWRI